MQDLFAELQSGRSDRLLLRVVSGSRAHGLHTAASDTDERGVFVAPLADYVSLQAPIEHVQDERGNVVFTGLRKFLALAKEANPAALELLYAPADTVMVRSDAFAPVLAARRAFVTRRALATHVGYARAQVARARGQHKWVNNPQPLQPPAREDFCHVVDGPWPGGPAGPRMPLRPRPLRDAGIDLRQCHCAALERVPRTYRLYRYGPTARGVFRDGQLVCEPIPVEHEAERLLGLLVFDQDGYDKAARDHASYWQWRNERNEARWQSQQDGAIDYDAKNMMHVFRLLQSAEHILATGEPLVRVDAATRDFLLAVRAGSFAYGDLVERAEARVAAIEARERASGLPEAPGDDVVDGLLRAVTQRWEAGRA